MTLSILVLFSCSTNNYQPETDESILVFYVEEFHKPITKPKVNLHIEELEAPLRLILKAPAAVIRTSPAEIYHAVEWSPVKKDLAITEPGDFEFTAPAGKISLVPFKIQIVNSSRIEVKPLSTLDLQYAKGRFSQNKDFAGLEIIYPEIAPSE